MEKIDLNRNPAYFILLKFILKFSFSFKIAFKNKHNIKFWLQHIELESQNLIVYRISQMITALVVYTKSTL